ncbi:MULTISPECIES: carboxylesterase family protein [Streptomyces]|uniref:carboxylesterase family protein n=1 Tax=Streptomyces TaxID=1883 RepID=UPI00163C917E|nr:MULTISPECIES: carboxylesterase family protein [Streptomyces]MBC2876168.1 carboxylesterase family protein [Streptomyces sp. TYQ1024]UBI35602.1 carboxylesterase family protein [Streptomyces mobaraensis]UKW28197.1 carboxylesterase family protein [Streptomyces sp. TYQ1024]
MPPLAAPQLRPARTPQGKDVDVHRPEGPDAGLPVVLLWHGTSPDDRGVLAPLAREVAARGAVVAVPDWRADAPDAGRAALLGSLAWCRANAAAYGGDPDRIVLAGWSAGAAAALGVALRPDVVDGWRPTAVVGLASRYDLPARTTGTPPLTDLADAAAGPVTPVPVRLVHGTKDTLMGPEHSREALTALTGRGWPTRLDEPAADHAGVIMAEFDPSTGRCRPSDDERVRAQGRLSVRALTDAAGVRPTLRP